MANSLMWLGHSTLALEIDGVRILVDPFLDENPACPLSAASVEADYVLVTHGHFDHVADAAAVAKRTGATVVANFEIGQWLGRHGVAAEKIVGMNLGGSVATSFGRVHMTLAHHSSSLPDGSYGGTAAGFVLEAGGKRIYLAGDTAMFLDMKLIGVGGLDLAVLPIGDLYTMGPDASLEAIKLLGAKRVLPCHYNTWPPIAQNANAWADRVRRETAAEPIVLEPGQRCDL
jgi:L-ascorbate metabolism protein UlaG (beta-lactamase superfamily)